MKIHGDRVLPVPRAAVWAALLDPEVLAKTLPGCERLAPAGENRFEGALSIKVGPVQGQFAGTVEMVDVEPGRGYGISVSGNGAPGFVDGRGKIQVEDAEGGTRLAYDLEIQVGGRIAGVGQRLLDSSARAITRQALDGLETQLVRMHRDGAAAAALPAPSATQFAGKVAQGVAADLVGPVRSRRLWALGAAAALAALIGVLAVRGCGG